MPSGTSNIINKLQNHRRPKIFQLVQNDFKEGKADAEITHWAPESDMQPVERVDTEGDMNWSVMQYSVLHFPSAVS